MIETYSAWTYGHIVDANNRFIPFAEGAFDFLAEMRIGSYTLDEYYTEVSRSMNEIAGAQDYVVTLDRATRLITISAVGNFTLQITSLIYQEIDAYELMGFTGADRTGSNSYEGDLASGSIFEPQYLLQSYRDFIDSQKSGDSSVNNTGSGAVEVISYGEINFMTCDIVPQTDIDQGKGNPITTDLNGVANLRNFLKFATKKGRMEFIPDKDDSNTFTRCILESTPQSGDGVDFDLVELYARGYANYYQSGILKFRELKD